MAGSYHQIYLHIVLNVLHRRHLLPDHCDDLCKYVTGIIQGKKHKMIRINNVPDHVHMLIGFEPDNNIAELVKVVKTSSNSFINNERLSKTHFYWMEGYGCFSVGTRKIDLDTVCHYIENQQEHHETISFKEEYRSLLVSSGVEFKEKYFLK